MKVQELIRFVTGRTGHPLGGEEYMTFGDPTREYHHILTVWALDEKAVQEARRIGADLIVHHEELFHPTAYNAAGPRRFLGWPVNQKKIRLLTENDLGAFRIHGSADELTIYDKVVSMLGLGPAPAASTGEWYCEKVFRSPVGTLGELAERVKKTFGIPHIRMAGNAADPVKMIGLPWGGMGLFVNVGYMETLVELGADTMICGETDNMGIRFATEQGIRLLEISHELSENDGLADFARLLSENLDCQVDFLPTPCVWHMV